MAIRVRSDGTTTTVDNVSAKGITIVKKVTVGRPVRKVNAAVVSINNLAGLNTSNVQDEHILVYNAEANEWQTSIPSGGNINTLEGIDVSAKVNGSVLVYNSTSEVFETTTELTEQTINGGQY
tara:strand:- start:983 stop:1351 length:369 start_codon:yes stop_codon:yes gene_type:complete